MKIRSRMLFHSSRRVWRVCSLLVTVNEVDEFVPLVVAYPLVLFRMKKKLFQSDVTNCIM